MYVGLASATASAESVAFLSKWSITFDTDDVDVTAFGDTLKQYVSGLPDVGGTFSGFFDDATVQTYTAATDGVARRFYLYPTTAATSGPYWFGTAIFDFAAEGDVNGAVSVSGNFKASTSVAKVG